MENIFNDAYFGKLYKTRDNRKAIYVSRLHDTNLLIIEGMEEADEFYDDGAFRYDISRHQFDIVSEWQESINKEEHKKEPSIHYTTSEIIHNILRDILHFEQHHEKSEGITQYIRNKYGKYI